jgi:DNA-directed RNA polymerase subunit K/omega
MSKINTFDNIKKVESNVILNSEGNLDIVSSLMTKYEATQIISLRTLQLAQGMPPFISTEKFNTKIKSNMELSEIAKEELKLGKIPFIIQRPMPNNKIQYVRVKDLDLSSVVNILN